MIYESREASFQQLAPRPYDLLVGRREYAGGDLCFYVVRGSIYVDFLTVTQEEELGQR